MDYVESVQWAKQLLQARGGVVSKRMLVSIAMAKLGLSQSGAYSLVMVLVGSGTVREIQKERRTVLVLVKEAIETGPGVDHGDDRA